MTRMTPLEMLDRLVGFDTVSSRSNLPLIEFVEGYLAAHGVASRRVPNPAGDKSNLFATIGPIEPGGVILSGHTDVVPVEGQCWSTDPFTLTERGGRLYGRGAADMKAYCAIALALVPEMLAAGLARPIHIALSYDEELGCVGAPGMIAAMKDTIPTPSAVIVGEPTSLGVVTWQKATFSMNTAVRGKSVHSSQIHRGVSAVAVGARLIAFLDDILRENMAKPPVDAPFDPPFTTVHTGMVHGGTAHNITAQDCTFVTDIRAVPGDDPHALMQRYVDFIRSEIEPGMKRIDPQAGVTVTVRADVPGLAPDADNTAEKLARRITGDNEVRAVSFGSEVGQFRQPGWSVVLCGPGSIDQAHQADEFISHDQLDGGIALIRGIVAAQAHT